MTSCYSRYRKPKAGPKCYISCGVNFISIFFFLEAVIMLCVFYSDIGSYATVPLRTGYIHHGE
uniref:Uncharacterized protein n=1 Tax=Anguilla anguilla TaxID=7936 RepID=A0A0E9RSR2_ANGAN